MKVMQQSDQYGTLEWFEREYGKVFEDPWGLTWRPSQWLRYRRALDMLEAAEEPISKIIDVGCATGNFTYLLSKQAGQESLLGVDFVDSAVERARQRFPSLNFATESIFDLGEKYPARFDAVACLEVLYYVEVPQRLAALRSLSGVLRHGGYAIFSSLIGPAPHFSTNELLDLVGSEFQIIGFETLHLRWVSLLEKAGSKFERLMQGLGTPEGNGQGRRHIGKLPLPAVAAIEKWSRTLKPLTASHTIILARART
jgi:2-polyprenyl-3-methyl-5-hydroxy-6-metoxy-1,4-benzoquinol methylase